MKKGRGKNNIFRNLFNKKHKKKNKKKQGISTIIVVIILIALVLIAVGILWAVISKILRQETEGVSLETLTVDAEITGADVDPAANNITISVKRKPGVGNLVGFRFVFDNGSNKELIDVQISMNELEEKVFTFHPEMNVSTIIKVSLVSLIKSGDKQIPGSVLVEYNVKTGQSIEPPSGGTTCTPATCASLGYECGTWANGTCEGTLDCNNPGCGSHATCPLGTCVCDSSWGDCNNDNICECDLTSYFCSGGSCVEMLGTAWYVDNAASGSNDGSSWINAWESFADIIWASIQPGDIIYIAGGTYNEQLDIDQSGSSGMPIIVRPATQGSGHEGTVIITNPESDGYGIIITGDHITVNGNVNGEPQIRVSDNQCNGIFIQGDGVNLTLTYLEIDNNGLVSCSGSHDNGIEINDLDDATTHLEISYCKIHDNIYGDQIKLTGASGPEAYGRFLIHHNEIYNLYDDGIETDARGVDFYNNYMHTVPLEAALSGAHIDGIAMNAGYQRAYNNIIYNLRGGNACIYPNWFQGTSECCLRVYNNLVYNDLPVEELYNMKGIEFAPQEDMTYVSDVVIANNVFAGMPTIGASLWFVYTEDFYFVNNIIYNCARADGAGEAFVTGDGSYYTDGSWGSGADVIIDYNIMHPGSEGRDPMIVKYRENWWYYDDFIDGSTCQENIDGYAEPLFDSNYKLQSGSPAIDTAINLSSYFTTDKDGIIRPQGSAWDVGVSEYIA